MDLKKEEEGAGGGGKSERKRNETNRENETERRNLPFYSIGILSASLARTPSVPGSPAHDLPLSSAFNASHLLRLNAIGVLSTAAPILPAAFLCPISPITFNSA